MKIMTYMTLVIICHKCVDEERDTLFSLNSVNIYIILYRAVQQTNIIYYSVLYYYIRMITPVRSKFSVAQGATP